MKLHRGAQYSDAYRQIAGNVVGAGMVADEIVAAMSKHGYFFTSAAPSAYGSQISRALSVAEVTLVNPVWTHAFNFSPFGMGFPNVAPMDFFYILAFNVRLDYSTMAPVPVNVFPPSLTVNITESGCATLISENQFITDVSQYTAGASGYETPHANYSFTLTGEAASCGAGNATFTVEIDHTAWNDYANYEWKISAHCIMMRK